MRVSEQNIELNILSTTTTLKSRCNTAPLPPGSMLVEQTGARVVIASIAFLNNIAWEGEGGRCLARQVFQHFEGNCSLMSKKSLLIKILFNIPSKYRGLYKVKEVHVEG